LSQQGQGAIQLPGDLSIKFWATSQTPEEARQMREWSGGPVLCWGDVPAENSRQPDGSFPFLALAEMTGDIARPVRAAKRIVGGVGVAVGKLEDVVAVRLLLEQGEQAGMRPGCVLALLDDMAPLRRLPHPGMLWGLKEALDLCNQKGVPFLIGGKASVARDLIPLWLGMGVRNWAGTADDAAELAEGVASLEFTAESVQNLRMVWPEVVAQPSARATRLYLRRAWIRS
jgi:hypothetical protein